MKAIFPSLVVLALFASTVTVPSAQAASSDDTNLMLIFDASGSMRKKLPSGEARIDAAKAAMEQVLGNVEEGVNLGLTMYGHRVKGECTDIELVAPIGSEDAATINGIIQNVTVKGDTPIADSIAKAVRSFRAFKGADNRIVLVTDGVEECGGNVCEAAQAAKDAGVDLKIDVVGFTLNSEQRQAMACVSDITGGKYYDAADAGELAATMKKVVKKSSDDDAAKDFTDDKNNTVTLDLGDRAFVDAFVTANTNGTSLLAGSEKPDGVIGVPDYTKQNENNTYYTLGCKGEAVWRFDDNALVDAAGPDLHVFELDTFEPTQLEISVDGKTWLDVGEIPGGAAQVDIASVAQPGEQYRFVKLTDLGRVCGNQWPGADIDAIAAINSVAITPGSP